MKNENYTNKEFNFIAELCQNHNGKFYNIEKMVNQCAENGAKTIKLQNVFSKDLTFRCQFENGYKIGNKIICIKRPYKKEYARLKKLEINSRNLEKFVKICQKLKVIPSITCFTKDSISYLHDIGFELIKVASYDCASFDLIRKLSKKFNKIIVSTGATYDDEIEKTVEILKKNKVDFSLLHCVTIYPTPFHNLHINRIKFLKQFTKNIGYSDHSESQTNDKNLASLFAIYHGAKIIERHITILDRDETRDGKVSINPADIKTIINFSKYTKAQQKEYLFNNFKFSEKALLGRIKRNLSHEELLNRDYYRGRFSSRLEKRSIFNWEENDII